MTNMERIQTLPRYKLAEFLFETFRCPYGSTRGYCHGNGKCMDCWIEWLNENDDG